MMTSGTVKTSRSTMTTDHDNLERLVREAAGPLPDPTASRRAIRASLAVPLARRERRQARQRTGATLALSVLLVVGLAVPLGGDDFEVAVTTYTNNGRQNTLYKQGLRGTEVAATQRSGEPDLTREVAEDLLMAKDTTPAIPVSLHGYRLGKFERITLASDYRLSDGRIITSSRTLPDRDASTAGALREWMRDDHLSPGEIMVQVVETALSRAPDFTTPMFEGGLLWIVDGWRVKLPGREAIIYLEGLRADGVRPLADD
jgi:hypothetical protein